jgi:CheY-like chemotaxis protein
MASADPAATGDRTALAVDIDPPFQHVMAAWLAARAYRVSFLPLSAAIGLRGRVDLVVCELAEPKQDGEEALRVLARSHPGAPVIALSSRFVADARRDALARQLGVQAALAKPCSRYDFHTALDAAVAMPPNTHHSHDDRHAPQRPRPGR